MKGQHRLDENYVSGKLVSSKTNETKGRKGGLRYLPDPQASGRNDRDQLALLMKGKAKPSSNNRCQEARRRCTQFFLSLRRSPVSDPLDKRMITQETKR